MHQFFRIRIVKVLFYIFNVLLTFNIFILPFDKIILPIYIIFLLYIRKFKVPRGQLIIGFSLLLYVSIISGLNIGHSNILILYPILFLFAAILACENEELTFSCIQKSLLVNIIIGGIFAMLAFVGYENKYSLSLLTKGVPYLYAPQGFLPTLQTYGTCCISWLIISFTERKSNKWLMLLVVFLLCSTLNRASLIFLVLLTAIYYKRIFISLSLFAIAVILYFLDFFMMILFSTSTIDSRKDLRVGTELSYWKSDDILVYLFGRANHQTSERIAMQTLWERTYIENGFDFIIHTYGILGFLLYVFLTGYFILYLFQKKLYSLSVISLFYYYFVQFITNEFLSASFYFFTLIIVKVAHKEIQKDIR